MHRHGYKGRKLRRDRDQRRALMKGLATQLVEHGRIETTLPKAKEVLPYAESLIGKAKAGGLHQRRQIISSLTTLEAAHKLVDQIAPKLAGRLGGHLRIKPSRLRVGDNARLATVSFVDDISQLAAASEKTAKQPAKTTVAAPSKSKTPAKQPAATSPKARSAASKPAVASSAKRKKLS